MIKREEYNRNRILTEVPAEIRKAIYEAASEFGYSEDVIKSQKRDEHIVTIRQFITGYLFGFNLTCKAMMKVINRKSCNFYNTHNRFSGYITYDKSYLANYELFVNKINEKLCVN